VSVAFLLAVAVLTSGCGRRPGAPGGGKGGKGGKAPQAEARAVEANLVSRDTMIKTLAVSGSLKAKDEVRIGSEIPGRVVRVTVDEGDRVAAGHLLIQLDEAEIRAQLRQAEAGVAVAEARVAQAKVGKPLTSSEIDSGIKRAQAALDGARAQLRQMETGSALTDTQIETAVKQAESQVAAAKQHLEALKKGSRDQQKAQAKQAVAQAKANLDLADTSLKRMKQLQAGGAAPQASVDEAQRQYDLAKAQHESARQQESLVGEGPRTEEIRVAEEQVRQAKNSLAQTKENRAQTKVSKDQIEGAVQQVRQAEAALELAKASQVRDSISDEDVKAAQAGVVQAKAGVAYAKEQLANTRIHSPLAGIVSTKDVDGGEMVSPGMALLHLVSLNTVYFEAAIAEVSVGEVHVGQPVDVTVDSAPDRAYKGLVSEVIPVADAASRTFRVKVSVPNADKSLKPGSFARGEIQLDRHEGALVVPRTALVRRDSQDVVYVVTDGTVREQPVEIGLSNPERAEILNGLDGSEYVVVVGADTLRDGQSVRVKRAN